MQTMDTYRLMRGIILINPHHLMREPHCSE